ncbi:transporter substrate-binding domain-containing protein [Ottowia thiooxydans]|uniref:Glutamate/aspartate transport system substrate-binding protein n=1 Tax=Ottowia thiooxydans TaxID=219182 RepID=A0ABV2Q543_9BURK
MKFRIALVASVLLTSTVGFAQTNDTLEKIRSSGVITMGHRDSSIPFSYITRSVGEPIGFAIDICKEVINAVKAELKLPNLTVKYQPVTSQNRVPLVQNGTVDIECGSTTNSVARQQQVAFSPNYIMVGVSAAVKKNSGINTFADLNGKTISTTTGTTSIPLLRAYKRADNVQVNEVLGKDHSDSFLLLAADRVSAFIMDDILLAGQIAASQAPGDYKILPEALRQEPYGIMLRKDDPKFKTLVDATVSGLMKSNAINQMYAKWFTSPIPPRNVNLNFPMSDATQELYRNPSDKGI